MSTLAIRSARGWVHLIAIGTLIALMSLSALAQSLVAPTSDWWSAIRRDDVSTVQGFLLRHVDPNAQNERGHPALVQATREKSWRVFDVLARAPGVDVDQANAYGETALMYLAILGETDRAAALIRAGAQVNRLGWTPLHYAAAKAQLEVAELLVSKGAIVNAPGPDGTTPLMMAARSGKRPMVQWLLDRGADATMFNLAGETAADWARKQRHTTLANQLDDLAQRVLLAKEQGGDEAAGSLPHALEQARAPQRAPSDEARDSGADDDAASFSRYFDLGRFDEEDAP